MSVKVYCEDCERKIKPEPIPVNHILYLFITLISFGIGVIFWAIAAFSTNDRYRCPICKVDVTAANKAAIEANDKAGKKKEKEFQEEHGLPWRWRAPVLLILMLIVYVITIFDTPESEVAWWLYAPWVFSILLALGGMDVLSLRKILTRDEDALIGFITGIFMLIGFTIAALVMKFAFGIVSAIFST